jgi:hypothetical protein
MYITMHGSKNIKLHVNYIARLLESLCKGSHRGLLQGAIAQNSAWMEWGGVSVERSEFEPSEYQVAVRTTTK